jgi:N-acetylmuramoyl-L-alanine amidase
MFTADSPLAERVVPSPNLGPRRGVSRPDMLILHYTGMESADAALARLCDPTKQVSTHYLVFEDGRTVQCVAEAQRAWHAGKSSWAGASDINSHSIGIEIANPGHDFGYPEFPAAQIKAVIALCSDIIVRQPVPPRRVLGHSDVAPARKRDPGEKFPWPQLFAAGIGHWVEPAPIDGAAVALKPGDRGAAVAGLQSALAHYGYGVAPTGAYDASTGEVVAAFQRHFRPARVDGIADGSTIATLHRLAEGGR